MSIESKHAYRFEYLKSEKWKAARLDALVREKGKCQICSEESISNDAHHIWYPPNIWDTAEYHLVILCRTCHDFIHAMRPECKTNDADAGRADWVLFRNAIIAWRRDKIRIFQTGEDLPPEKPVKAAELRDAYEKLKKKCQALKFAIEQFKTTGTFPNLPEEVTPEKPKKPKREQPFEDQVKDVLKQIKRWAFGYHESVTRVKDSIESDDFQI